MPKKGRKTNVAQQVKASGNRSETFAQGQRRVSTPRGRSSALQLAPQPEPQTAQRLSMYSAQSQQQVGRDLARRDMDEFYQARAQGQQGQQQAFAQAQQAVVERTAGFQRQQQAQQAQQRQQQARAELNQRRETARATARGFRNIQATREATKQSAMSDRLSRAPSKSRSN